MDSFLIIEKQKLNISAAILCVRNFKFPHFKQTISELLYFYRFSDQNRIP